MNNNDLTGRRFEDKDGTEYVIAAGNEGEAIAYEDIKNPNAPLFFCCDAFVIDNRLRGTYFVSYTVSKAEFFKVIEQFSEQEKACADTIASSLRKKYFKIPTVFLRLVGEMYGKDKTALHYHT